MIDLEFDSVTLDPFCEYTQAATLPLHRLGRGLTFVRAFNKAEPALGSNGGGKSTIFDAMTWCLFGRTTDGRRGTDVRPWALPKEDAYVKLVMYINNRKEVVERSTKSNGLWINGKVVNQEAVDALVGMTLPVFTAAIIFGQGQPLFFDLKPGEKLKLLSDALHLDRWNDHVQAATKRTAAYDRAFTSAVATLQSLDDNAIKISDSLDDAIKQADKWDEEEARLVKHRRKAVEENKEALERARNVLGTYDLDYDNAETELRHAQAQVDKLDREVREASISYDRAKSHLNATDDRLADLKAERKNTTDKCPTCGQVLKDKKARDEHAARLDHTIQEVGDLADTAYYDAKKKGELLEELRAKLRTHEDDLKAWRQKSNDAIDNRTRAQSTVNALRADVESGEAALKAKPSNPWEELVRSLKDQKRDNTDAAKEAHQLVKLTTAKHASNKFWINGFKQVRLYLLEDFLMELEVITQDMLPRLGLIGWEVQLRIERETQKGDTTSGLTVAIRKPGVDKAIKWESFSGGEAQRLRVAGALALSETLLRRAGVNCDLAVFDEPTRGLSPEGVDDLVDSLLEIGRDRQLILIDHTARQSSRFAHIVTVTRDKSGSRLAVD